MPAPSPTLVAGPVVVILGPTATGKTALGVELAERLGGEILNADALQAYRHLSIGTAKPSPEELRRVRHHLLDVLEPDQRFSAGEFARRAREVITELRSRGQVPFVVGGSGLYLRALLEGISPIPPGDPEVRAELEDRLAAEGLPALYAQLQVADPATAARLGAGDTQRILRALEVARVTGRPLSAWIADQPFGEQRLPALRIGLTLPRNVLYHRISERVERMLAAGWVQEVAKLLAAGWPPEAPAFQAIGYRQLVRHVRGELTLNQATEDIVRETRRFAKRQMTWFRREPRIRWLDARELPQQLPELAEWVAREVGQLPC